MAQSFVSGDETKQLQALHSLKVLDIQPEARFERLTCMAKRMFSVPVAVLYLTDRTSDTNKHVQAIARFEAARDSNARSAADVLLIPDAFADERFKDAPISIEGFVARFYAGCPVVSSYGERMGTLCLIDSAPRTLSAEDMDLFEELARMVSDVYRSLAQAISDELTKLANRRGFESIAAHLLPMAARLDIPVALIEFDLDGFKQVNDEHGHEAGDRMLASFARHLLKVFRESDVIARLGGDEFCVLMSGASKQDVVRCLRELKACLQRAPEPVRFSAGVASLDRNKHGTIGDLLAEADRRMYECKRRKQRSAAAAVG